MYPNTTELCPGTQKKQTFYFSGKKTLFSRMNAVNLDLRKGDGFLKYLLGGDKAAGRN